MSFPMFSPQKGVAPALCVKVTSEWFANGFQGCMPQRANELILEILWKKFLNVIWLLMANPSLNLRMSQQLICRGTCIIVTWSDLANRWIYRRQILGDLPSYAISNLMLSVTSLLLVNLLLLTTIFSFISVKDNWMGQQNGRYFYRRNFQSH